MKRPPESHMRQQMKKLIKRLPQWAGLLAIMLNINTLSPFQTLAAQTDSNAAIPLDRPQIYSAEWSPNGSVLALNTRSSVYFYNQSLDEISFASLPVDADADIRAVSWHPDSEQLVIADTAGVIYLWTTARTKIEKWFELPLLEGQFLSAIDWSPDGKQLAFILKSKPQTYVRVWNIAAGEVTANLPITGDLSYVVWSPNGNHLLVHGVNFFDDQGTKLQVWNIHTFEPVLEINNMTTTGWSPDGQFVAVADLENNINILNIVSGEILETIIGQGSLIRGLAWSADGQQLAGGSGDGSIYIWQISNHHLKATLKGHKDWVFLLHWLSDERIASVSFDNAARIWDISSRRQLDSLQTHAAVYIQVDWHPNGDLIATGGLGDPYIRLWNTDGELIRILNEPENYNSADGFAWSSDGSYLAAADDSLTVWDANTWQVVWSYETPGSSYESLAWQPGTFLLAVGDVKGNLVLWDGTSGTQLGQSHIINRPIQTLDWSPDGQHLAVSNGYPHVYVYDAQLNEPLIVDHGDFYPSFEVVNAVWLSNHHLLTRTEYEGDLILWRMDRNSNTFAVERTDNLGGTEIARQPGTDIVAVSTNHAIALWNIETGEFVRTVSLGDFGEVISSLSWSPDGTRLAVGTYIEGAQIIDLSDKVN